ncbi:MAG: 4-(cytidine 5'-diphospho)-2-C-methyl-D-erythritol kinase [Bacteroidales bacterium]|nr:4-(cytidine 5'-diphospho)-2-C-methyl-D-erythritol kinase [Bacteroidales bacterium]
MQILAPAKINLSLKILNKRKDGYHNIVSLFHKIKLYDEIIMEVKSTPIFSCKVSGNFNFPEKENLIFKAAELYSRYIQRGLCFSISCKKKIPQGSGLGGGSSDAAATLKAINLVMNNLCSDSELMTLAGKLGSDVPFFIDKSNMALITGRGEKIVKMPRNLENYWLVLVFPGFKVSSYEAYKKFDLLQASSEHTCLNEKTICDQLSLSPEFWDYTNDFEKIITKEYPLYNIIKEQMINLNALFYSLTGSGSAYFGVFSNQKAAETASESLNLHLPSHTHVKYCQL